MGGPAQSYYTDSRCADAGWFCLGVSRSPQADGRRNRPGKKPTSLRGRRGTTFDRRVRRARGLGRRGRLFASVRVFSPIYPRLCGGTFRSAPRSFPDRAASPNWWSRFPAWTVSSTMWRWTTPPVNVTIDRDKAAAVDDLRFGERVQGAAGIGAEGLGRPARFRCFLVPRGRVRPHRFLSQPAR
jgi:hypothetical protein